MKANFFKTSIIKWSVCFSLIAIFSLAFSQEYNFSGNENEFLKKLLHRFETFFAQLPEDRVYLHTDKPFYKPGDTIFFSAYVRNASDLQASEKSDFVYIDLITPKGTEKEKQKLAIDNGRISGNFNLEKDIVGGIYVIKAYTNWQKNDPEPAVFEKEIQVQNVVLPNLKMKLDFEKKAYGAGDQVIAKIEVNTNENSPLSNQKFEFVAMLKGEKFESGKLTTNAEGKAEIHFKLPVNITTSEGLVNIMLPFKGSTESISRSIPIIFNKIKLDFFPEGGDMVNGLENKIAFRALNEYNKPADIEGILIDNKDKEICRFTSFHFGMGAFTFIPGDNETYCVKITSPKGIQEKFKLPQGLHRGYILNVGNKDENSLKFDIKTTEIEQITLIGQVRGKIWYSENLQIKKGSNSISVETEKFPCGVAQFTLFDYKGIERAERLVFINRNKQLDILVSTDKDKYVPGEKVKMTIMVKDERGMPMPASLSLAVVNDQLLSFADDKQGNILSKLYLEPDIKGKIEEPIFYFKKDEPKAEKALDYLLLTSGWRRFVWKTIIGKNIPVPEFQAEQMTDYEKDIIKNGIIGIVKDENGNPLPGVNIIYKGTQTGVISDLDGKFILRPPVPYNTLIFSYIGYESQEIQIKPGKELVIKMKEDQHAIEEVIVVGFGGERRAEGNIAFAEFDREDMVKEAPVMQEQIDDTKGPKNEDVANVLTGKVAGVDLVENKKDNDGTVRTKEFAKSINDQEEIKERKDFRSTIYWNPVVEVDKKGIAELEFYNNDEISSFRAIVEGIGQDGLVGRTEKVFYTQQPVSLTMKMPSEIAATDLITLPLVISNNTNSQLTGNLNIMAPESFILVSEIAENQTINANSSKTIFLDYKILSKIGEQKFSVVFRSGVNSDAFSQNVKVISKGYPVSLSFSGQDLEKEYEVNIDEIVEGSLQAQFVAFPSVVSDLMKGVEGILREPYGCFEQTSMSSYPNLMVMDYLNSIGSDDKKLMASAENLLDKGYKRLTSFETPEKGYEWFGGAPAHEALTAYGLMQFNDMKGTMEGVDQEMIDRTASWLLKRKNGKGGFLRNNRALDSYGRASEEVTNAYIVYALSEAGYKDIELELEATCKFAEKSNDPYQIALLANAMFKTKNDKKALDLLDRLSLLQQSDGSWEGSQPSITYSTGNSLKIETTSLALMAQIKNPKADNMAINKAVKFLLSSRSGYGDFGSTQGTILALKALTQYAKFSKKTSDSGVIVLKLEGKNIATQGYEKGQNNSIEINGLEKYLKTGKQKISIQYKDTKNALPYSLAVNYFTPKPASSKECKVGLKCLLNKTIAKVGEIIRLNATLTNKSNGGLPMTIAIIGIPAGLSAQPWELKELKDKQVIDFYEITGNNVVCYYRQIKPSEIKEINLNLKADFAGEFDAPASSAYLYYTNEFKDWCLAGKIKIEN